MVLGIVGVVYFANRNRDRLLRPKTRYVAQRGYSRRWIRSR